MISVLQSAAQSNELAELYEKHIRTFYYVAYSRLHNQHDAEDAVQEAFLSVADNPDIFFRIPAEKRVSYINVVIKNQSCRIYNKKHKAEAFNAEIDENTADEQTTPEDFFISECACRELLCYIDTLPEAEKSAIYLRIYFGLKNSDIAKTLGISEEAAKKRVTRAVNRIKKHMEDLNDGK